VDKNKIITGTGWKLTKNDGDFILELYSPYGTVEVKQKGMSHRYMCYDILMTYEDLEAQGPIEVESEQTL